MNIYKQIFKQIKKYDTIVIERHIGADPDALGSQFALKNIILELFPDKKVYTVGNPASRFKFFGSQDKIDNLNTSKAMCIVLDTPDIKRIDGANINNFEYVIKIDHHPFIEDFGGIEWIDDTASSASQMIIELSYKLKLTIPVCAAEKLYIGLVADTNRFLFYYTTPKTFMLVSKLIEDTKLDFTKLYDSLYMRPMREIRFQSYIASNLKITENGFGYAYIKSDVLAEYNVDAATAGNMVNNFNYIEDIIAWAIFSEDKNNNNVRVSIRSRGPIINETASKFGGGGHIYASGVKLDNFDLADKLVEALDNDCKNYKQK